MKGHASRVRVEKLRVFWVQRNRVFGFSFKYFAVFCGPCLQLRAVVGKA